MINICTGYPWDTKELYPAQWKYDLRGFLEKVICEVNLKGMIEVSRAKRHFREGVRDSRK